MVAGSFTRNTVPSPEVVLNGSEAAVRGAEKRE